MITLISKWKLKNGCPPELVANLKKVAEQVKHAEPETLMYSVHLPNPSPLNSDRLPKVPPPSPYPLDSLTEVMFFEIYQSAEAFSYHVNGPTFTKFRKENICFFQEDPNNPGWPVTDTKFYERESAFVRPEAG